MFDLHTKAPELRSICLTRNTKGNVYTYVDDEARIIAFIESTKLFSTTHFNLGSVAGHPYNRNSQAFGTAKVDQGSPVTSRVGSKHNRARHNTLSQAFS